jgi:hypothetical protein
MSTRTSSENETKKGIAAYVPHVVPGVATQPSCGMQSRNMFIQLSPVATRSNNSTACRKFVKLNRSFTPACEEQSLCSLFSGAEGAVTWWLQ